jgi:hypothetical protein
VKGENLEDALYLRGFLPRKWVFLTSFIKIPSENWGFCFL